MQKNYVFILSPLVAFFLYMTLSSSSGGITGRSVVGCGGSGCHGTASSASTAIIITGLPAGGYVNSTVYSITLTISNSTIAPSSFGLRDGFDMTATAGSFTAIPGTALNGATEIRHSTPKLAPTGTTSWTFNWTSPASGSATVTFNVAGNATNGDGSPSALDKWNTFSTTVVKAPVSVTASSSAIACNGGISTITATGAGGTTPYQYKLNAGAYQTPNTFAGNLAGTYTVTIKDALNITATTAVTINQPALLTFNAPTITSPLCNGGTGSMNLTATGGTGTKTYTITPLGPQTNTTGNFSLLTAQTYTVTVSDASSCTKTSTVVISQPALISFGSPTITNPPCNGGTGSLSAPAVGGTGTKTYSISPLGPQTNITGNFSLLTAQTYTVTVSDANNCSKTSTFTISAPAAIAFIAPAITNPVCNGGTGGIQIIASGGTGTKFYSINPLGPQTNATGTFSSLTAQTYTISVIDANSCSLTTLVTLTQPPPVVVTSSNVSGCQGSPIALIGSPSGGVFSVANPYTGPSTTYSYTFTNGAGCSTTSSPSSITVTPVTTTNIVTTGSSSFCQTLTQVSGTNLYANASCQLISSIVATGLGTTNACVNFLSGTPSWNGEPYANRVYAITPATQPVSGATLCLYYTATDMTSAGITNDADISITKVGGNGILGGTGSVTEILNSSMVITNLSGGIKEVCFPVSSFSSFYLHSKNPGNVPLPVVLTNFTGEPSGSADLLTWKTQSEINSEYFNVQYSKDGIRFETIGTVESKSVNGYSANELAYAYSNENTGIGLNYYRLEQVDIDRKSRFSEIISVFRTENEGLVNIYPNPTEGVFTIDSKWPVQIRITDINGHVVFEKTDCTQTSIELAKAGLYVIRLTDNKGQQSIRKLIVR